MTTTCSDVSEVPISAPADDEDAAGVVVLAADGTTAFADDVAAAWLDELDGHGSMPRVLASVASRARTVTAGAADCARMVRAHVQAESGWLVVRASALGDEPTAHVAVIIEPARPHELAPLVADAYRLTARERQVTRLVARGLCTDAIAARLYLSSWTVQDHLKAIFEKVGVTTRGELVARLFFQQQVPEL
jgi:DNA-binding NarL/FixJ family response regulator